MSDNNNFKCEFCNQFYSSKFSLTRHIKVKHRPKNSSLTCGICEASFLNEKLLSKHIETHEIKSRLKCPLCNFVSHVSIKLNEHIKCHHNIDVEIEIHHFKSSEEFFEWKLDTEKSDVSKFVKYCGNSKIKDGSTRSYYYCHRSYVHKPRVLNRMKKVKKQGIAKIGSHCPASMKVIYKKDGTIKVHYVKTHLGHEKEMCYINLSIDERTYLASLISRNMSFDHILRIIKNNNADYVGKLNFVTKADLHNIRRSFNLYNDSNSANNTDDLVETDIWIKRQFQNTSCCVLLYKPQGESIDGYASFEIDDFFLAIMTENQETVLKQQSFSCICMESIQSINISELRLELLTLTVVDKEKQEFPSAFLITSKMDFQVVEIFLTLIKNKTGILKSNIFLSNVKDGCYDVWCKVMNNSPIKLFCSWNVNYTWRLALQKINSSIDESSTYNVVKDLVEEKDKNVFQDKFQEAIEKLCSNKKTCRFGEYLKENFGNNTESWAYCYRTNFGLENDMQLERIHRTLKYLFISVKTLKRLDKSIIEINKFVQEKFFNKCKIPSKEGKIISIREMDNRHKASLRLKSDWLVNEGSGWKIESQSRPPHTFIIRDISPNCNCSLICDPCNVCVHRFCCSCSDSSVMWRMCKHIHLLCRTLEFKEIKDNLYINPYIITQNNRLNEIPYDPQLENQLLQAELNTTELDGLVESIYLNKVCTKEIDQTIQQKVVSLKKKFAEILEMVETENEVSLIQNSLDLLHTSLTEKNNYLQETICVPNELAETSPPPLVLVKQTGLSTLSNNIFATSLADNNPIQFSENISNTNDIPLPPLVPFKQKNTPFILLNQKNCIQPLSVQLISIDQESADNVESLKAGNVFLLPN